MADDAHQRAAFRRWARENHPDLGGDAAVFAAGVEAAREGRWAQFDPAGVGAADNPQPESSADHRPSRTIIYVARSAHGVGKLIASARKWNERRKMPPRVQ